MATRQAHLADWTARGRLPGWGPFLVVDDYVSHPLLAPRTVQHRAFQVAIAARAARESTLVVLPTGLGKTVVAALVAAEVLRQGGKVVMLAPTRPLTLQHAERFAKLLPDVPATLFTGAEKDRPERFAEARLVFATPQGMANDLEEGRYTLADVALLIVDEAHRAVGEYAYVPIAAHYQEARDEAAAPPLVLGLTASPGSKRKRVDEVVGNLGIRHVISRQAGDDDVADHVHDIDVTWVRVTLPKPMLQAQKRLRAMLHERVVRLQRSRFVPKGKPAASVGKGDLIAAGDTIRKRLARRRDGFLFAAMANAGVAFQAYHTLELLETQGVVPFQRYLAKLEAKEKPGKAEKVFLKDKRLVEAAERVQEVQPSHPKLDALVGVVREELAAKPEGLVLVFAQYRDTIATILDALEAEDIPGHRFVGQADRGEEKGMKQAEQAEVLDRFRAGEFRVLVASSVAEEGLDIPQVDLVVFYEPVVSEIRSIQRRGRTGRGRGGRVVVLVAEGTRDEAYLRAEAKREKDMASLVGRMGAESEDEEGPEAPEELQAEGGLRDDDGPASP